MLLRGAGCLQANHRVQELLKVSVEDIVPHFVATITLYPTDKGGRASPIVHDWFGCPCKFDEADFSAWDCRILTRGERFSPGETKQFGVVFLTAEAAPLFRRVKKFYLWEGWIIGEARATISINELQPFPS
jgi:hypothetical protein